MRFLKTKIAISQKLRKERARLQQKQIQSLSTAQTTPLTSPDSVTAPQPKKRVRIPGKPVTTPRDRATKNLVKNYGKAICSFTCSDLAVPYLLPLTKEHGIKMNEFVRFISNAKESIESISSFRNLLLVKEEDNEQSIKFKKVFASICEIFIKCFSVNWIFSGKVTYKEMHLKFRFKLLRRIRNPECFTYMSTRGRKESL